MGNADRLARLVSALLCGLAIGSLPGAARGQAAGATPAPAPIAPATPAVAAGLNGADVTCNIASVISIRPYVINPMDGSHQLIVPGPRFELRVGNVLMVPYNGSWSVGGTAGQSTRFLYEVRDTENGGNVIVAGESIIFCPVLTYAVAPAPQPDAEMQTRETPRATPSNQDRVSFTEHPGPSALFLAGVLTAVGGVILFGYSYSNAWNALPAVGVTALGITGSLAGALIISRSRRHGSPHERPGAAAAGLSLAGVSLLPCLGSPGIDATIAVSF